MFPFLLILFTQSFNNGFIAKKNLVKPIFIIIILAGAIFSIAYAVTLEDRMQNENYTGLKESISFIEKNVSDNEKILFHAPIHLYLNTQNKGTKNPSITEEIQINYILLDGWTEFSEKDFTEFEVIFESENKTSRVLKRKS